MVLAKTLKAGQENSYLEYMLTPVKMNGHSFQGERVQYN